MIPAIDWWLIFLAGILGSAHCIGMCGSLVSAFFIRFDGQRSMVHVSAYHLTRISVYGFLGLSAAAIGQSVVMAGLAGKGQGILKILVGVLILFMGFELYGISPWRLRLKLLPAGWTRSLFAKARGSNAFAGSMISGFVNGFIPCTLVFAMITKAVDAPSIAHGGLLMLIFGLGTLPSMFFVSYAFARLSPKLRGALSKVAAIFIILLGAKTLWEGLLFFNVMRSLSN